MMLLLTACSVVLVAIILERFVAIGWAKWKGSGGRRGAGVGHHCQQNGASTTLQRSAGPTAPPWHRKALQFFWDIPPQIGLLGTVLGLVQIFQGDLGAEAFGRGVGTACFTTVFGLSIALVARSTCYLFDMLTAQPNTPADPAGQPGATP